MDEAASYMLSNDFGYLDRMEERAGLLSLWRSGYLHSPKKGKLMTFMDDVCYWRVDVFAYCGVSLPKGRGAVSSTTMRQVMMMDTMGRGGMHHYHHRHYHRTPEIDLDIGLRSVNICFLPLCHFVL